MENGGESFLRQPSVGPSPCYYYNSSSTTKSSSKRRGTKKKSRSQMEEDDEENCESGKKRVMVVIDQGTRPKHAMMWALTHIVNRGDILTLLHVVPPACSQSVSNKDNEYGPDLANSLGSLCKACKPEVEVEALVIQGHKLATVLSEVKTLETSVLVLSQS